MTTDEIVKTLAARLQISQREARRHLRHLFDLVAHRLQKGETVSFPNLGALHAAPGKARRTFDATTQEFVPQPRPLEFFFKSYQRLKTHLQKRRTT